MTARSLTNSKRPLSAIFLGGTSPPSLADTPPKQQQQQQLPSPPSSSKDSNSNGDKDEAAVGVTNTMKRGIGIGLRRANDHLGSSSDDDAQDDNEDHTARLTIGQGSNASERRRIDDRESVMSSRAGFRDEAALERSASLAARNRQVRLSGRDRRASILSNHSFLP